MEIVIVGIEHHNMLNLARDFFQHGVKPIGLIVSSSKYSAVKWSKYWKKVIQINSDDELIDTLIKREDVSGEKDLLLLTSDASAREVDKHLDDLREHYICPNINYEKGRIHELMDKYHQLCFARDLGLPTISSNRITIDSKINPCKYPCILKPLECGTGIKNDITICYSNDDYFKALDIFFKHGCCNLIVQDYIKYDYEFEISGFCSDRPIDDNNFFATRFLRSYPPNKGTACFGHLISDNYINSVCKDVLEKIRNYGFRGLINIEFFYRKGEIYLNEINWRNAGGMYNGHSSNANIGYRYYLSMAGIETEIGNIERSEDFFMTEYSDLRYVLYLHYGISNWIKDFRKTKNFAFFHKEDLKPALVQYAKIVSSIIKGKYRDK